MVQASLPCRWTGGNTLALRVSQILSSAWERPWRTIWHKGIVFQLFDSCSSSVLRQRRSPHLVLQAKPTWLLQWRCSSSWTPCTSCAKTRHSIWRIGGWIWDFATLSALAASSSVAWSNPSCYNNLWAPRRSFPSSLLGMNTYDYLQIFWESVHRTYGDLLRWDFLTT